MAIDPQEQPEMNIPTKPPALHRTKTASTIHKDSDCSSMILANNAPPRPPSPHKALQPKPQQPPPLPYSLHEHKLGIALAFTSTLISASILPLILYFTLTRFTRMPLAITLTIIESVPILQLLEWALRFYQLAQPAARYRPLNGSPRWALDFYQWAYTGGVVGVTVVFIVGAAVSDVALVGLALPLLLMYVGGAMVFGQLLAACGARSPLRLSSLPAGSVVRPPVYLIVEDVTAVNGGGGTGYRRAIDERYRASAPFRRLMGTMSWFWAVPATLLGAMLAVLLYTIDVEVAWCLVWTVPWIWAGLWAYITIRWVRHDLEEERRVFAIESA